MKPEPPQFALRFLRWFCKDDCIEEIEGNLIELYEKEQEINPSKAMVMFFWHVLKHVRPVFIKSTTVNKISNPTPLMRHNLLHTYRTFSRYKSSFFINLLGLSTGLASALLIYLWVSDELSVDKFHQKDSQLYQVMTNFNFPSGIETWEYSPGPLAEALVNEMPEVETATHTNNQYHHPKGLLSYEENSLIVDGLFASKNYFEVFSFDLVQGQSKQVLANLGNIVISEELAIKLFGSPQAAIGKSLTWNNRFLNESFQVSGVFDIPKAATAKFDVVVLYDWLIKYTDEANDWSGGYAITYLILEAGTDIDQFNEKIHSYISSKNTWSQSTQFVQQYSSRYLFGSYKGGEQIGGRIENVRLFSAIAIFIMAIAAINFMNLSTAQASDKMKAIGVKKAIGVSRRTLVMQLLSESTLLALLALIVAALLIVLVLPQFSYITSKFLSVPTDVDTVLTILGVTLLTGLLAGSYPAFYLSGFKPVTVLKGKLRTSHAEVWIRKGLVTFQFVVSVVFIVGVLVVSKQMDYTLTKNLGYDKKNIISFERPPHQDDPSLFLSKLKDIAGVEQASNMYWSVLHRTDNQSGFSWNGEESNSDFLFDAPRIGYDVVETLGMELVTGRSFSRDFNDDHTKIILNESAVAMMGLENPIGKILAKGSNQREVIGVVKDFHYGSIHNSIDPLVFRFRNSGRDILVRINVGAEMNAIRQIEALFKEFHEGYPFEFTFFDNDYQALYTTENKVGILSRYFSGIAIIISCLGLFGLTSFTAERRKKEIGVRKILGCSNINIVRLLSGDFTKMVLAGVVIAIPLSFWVAENWLQSFAYRINLQWWLFAVAGLMAFLIAWFTVGFQTLKSANANPVESLKEE